MKKNHKTIPESMIGNYYKSRDFDIYLRILDTYDSIKAKCLIAEVFNDDISVCTKNIQIDDFEQPDDYIIVRDIEGSIAYTYDRISDEVYVRGMQDIIDDLRDKAYGDQNP